MAYSKNCVDCVSARKEGYGTCAAHYDAKEDNTRSMKQTGKPIEGYTKRGTSDGSMRVPKAKK